MDIQCYCISETPLVTIDCSRYSRANISDDFSCLCRGRDGNPPAQVTWYKDNTKIGDTGEKSQLLQLRVVDKSKSGKYKCEAKSHEKATNTTFIELTVNCKFVVISI